jgi:hypothetical protein
MYSGSPIDTIYVSANDHRLSIGSKMTRARLKTFPPEVSIDAKQISIQIFPSPFTRDRNRNPNSTLDQLLLRPSHQQPSRRSQS